MYVKGIIETKVDVNEIKCLESIIAKVLNKMKYSENYHVKDNKVVETEDVSYHGSPDYQDFLITDDPEKVELFTNLDNSIKILKKLGYK